MKTKMFKQSLQLAKMNISLEEDPYTQTNKKQPGVCQVASLCLADN